MVKLWKYSTPAYKYLGTIFEDILKWDLNTDAITRKGHQRFHLLPKLRSFNVDPTILKLFYNSFIENVLTFSFICWFYNLNVKQTFITKNCTF